MLQSCDFGVSEVPAVNIDGSSGSTKAVSSGTSDVVEREPFRFQQTRPNQGLLQAVAPVMVGMP